MGKLRKSLIEAVLIALALYGCGKKENKNILTEAHFDNAEWTDVPYKGEIWTSYIGEGISRYNRNWEIYQAEVAQKNGFRYIEKDGRNYIVEVRGKTILLPDLDSNGYIIRGKDTVNVRGVK